MSFVWGLEKISPAGPERLSGQGPDESSPVRSAGLAFLKSIRPGRDDRQMLAIAEPRAKSKAECFDRPYGTDLPFTSFPSTSYWATFTESLRDKSPHHTILALKLTRMGFSLGGFSQRDSPRKGERMVRIDCLPWFTNTGAAGCPCFTLIPPLLCSLYYGLLESCFCARIF